jgi:DNA-binding MurR/RpiR family transcriptional regulator
VTDKLQQTLAERIRTSFDDLTPTERKLANSMLENYPVSCLSSITQVAASADVSSPTVVRMVKKLGFTGFPDFQATLHNELEEQITNPIAKFNRWSKDASDTHILNRFADAVIKNLDQSLKQIDPNHFDEVVKILSTEEHTLHIVGGRITSSLADYFFNHMQMIRRGVFRLGANPSRWPHYLLNMEEGDFLVAFDVRRYEENLLTFCKIAKSRGVRVILLTDQWGSPAAKYSEHVFNLRIEAPSAWDSSVVSLFVLEALISAIQTEMWDSTKDRMKDLENLFDETKLFKK